MASPNNSGASPAESTQLSLKVKSFRCFSQEVAIDLSDSNGQPAMWNVILGENGVGKTTILQAIDAMQRPAIMEQVTHGSPKIYVSFPNLYSSFRALINDIVFQVAISIEGHVSHYIYTQSPNDDLAFIPQSGIRTCSLRCNSYGANRRMSKRALSETLQSDASATLFDDSAELINAEEWLLQADYATKTATGIARANALKRLEQVKELIKGILPQDSVSDIRFGLNEDTAVMTPRVEAKTPYGWVRLRNLSLGYQAALTWIVDLAARMIERYPDSPNPFAEPAIVLVDEIDLHLHPKWQRELIEQLTKTFPKTQFIVTAHSPLIVQATPNANIALLKRVGDHVEIDNDVDHIRNWRADQILTSDLFGLESARPPYLDAAFREREELLTKPELTDADWKRLDELSEQIGETNEGERTGDIEAQNLIRRAAQLLQKQ